MRVFVSSPFPLLLFRFHEQHPFVLQTTKQWLYNLEICSYNLPVPVFIFVKESLIAALEYLHISNPLLL